MAILRQESESERFVSELAKADSVRMSAGTWIELGAVTSKDTDAHFAKLIEHLVSTFAIGIEPVSVEHARIGHEAYRRYGKGHHPARLNLGDCFSYALAKATGEPLLFKGNDFSQTDIKSALPAT